MDSAAAADLAAVAARVEAGDSMRTKEFLGKLDHDRIVEAIRAAEQKSSGQIRVYLHRGNLKEDALGAAQERFRRLGMEKTQDRNAVLIFVASRAHKFAVIGDQAIHQKCGDALWQNVVGKMRDHFQNERFSDAIVDAIRDIGEVLAEHFPKTAAATPNLPDEVVEE